MKSKPVLRLRQRSGRWLCVAALLGGLSLVGGCGDSPEDEDSADVGTSTTGGLLDGGSTDGGSTDGGSTDGGSTDGGTGAADGGDDGGYNPGLGENVVVGQVLDEAGSAVEGVRVTFYTVPRNGFYETYTAADGTYAYKLPDGVYQTFAFYGDPGTELDNVVPVDLPGSSFTVPPDQEINFLWAPYD
ncbi:carboxypeptidase-like regulatory domain-containing protein [Streptomyces neyagawaensis]|uniref:carboxypeptidase-like regulatory domain-containing protein n=1 Tax=Streptomyces neyagawaensis TaxID=42238 RepID=UPI0006E34AAD|nr:carboxypeptidase-like regulatory domain-containing protein [Streptomyces neyagawaensis]MCL6736342.1 carboxypeptidase-like regulatory domain-containing protein [Streptomyces neyagawaensis]MDE1686034.1 carboxypeptidase-like regulatory domain-containing protein [Streptomyces neyagawaensis]